MSTALKCPNPSCPYLFDPSRVPAGVVLTCPRCGMRFTLGPALPASANQLNEVPQRPDASFDGMSQSESEVAGPDDKPQRRSLSAAGGSSPLQTGIITFICFVMLAGVGTMIYLRFASGPNTRQDDSGIQLRNHNLYLDPPGEPWVRDEDVSAKLGPPMIIAFKRSEPDAYFAIGARDYESKEPRPRDLRITIDTVLDRAFEEVQKTQLTGLTFLGQPAQVSFSFTANQKDGDRVTGLCFATHYRGIAYWSLSWAGEKDAESQAEVFDAIRSKLKIGTARDNWTAKELPIRVFGGHAASYQIVDGEDIWKEPDMKERSPADEDKNGDLLLVARIKSKGQDQTEEATLLAIVLDGGGGDPLAQGRRYVEEQRIAQVKLADPKFMPRFIERTGPPDGDPPSSSLETSAPVVRLQMTVQGASSYSKLLVISAIKVGDRVVVVSASCGWSDREVFESKLIQIAGSLRELR